MLRGRDHTGLAEISAIAEGPTAVAISRGGAAKTYAYRDANEDAAAFAWGDGGALLVVADAHAGCAASELAVASLVERVASLWTGAIGPGEPWPDAVRHAIGETHTAVVAAGAASRTTLALALVRPGDDRLAWASIGDSHVFRVADGRAVELAAGSERASNFLGSAARTAPELVERIRLGEAPLAGARAVMLATDGLSERGIGLPDPAAAVVEAAARAEAAPPDLAPLTAARHLVSLALDSHRRQRAGDNIATALWLSSGGG